MSESKKEKEVKDNTAEITSFKAYKKKYFPKKYAEEQSLRFQPPRFKRQ